MRYAQNTQEFPYLEILDLGEDFDYNTSQYSHLAPVDKAIDKDGTYGFYLKKVVEGNLVQLSGAEINSRTATERKIRTANAVNEYPNTFTHSNNVFWLTHAIYETLRSDTAKEYPVYVPCKTEHVMNIDNAEQLQAFLSALQSAKILAYNKFQQEIRVIKS